MINVLFSLFPDPSSLSPIDFLVFLTNLRQIVTCTLIINAIIFIIFVFVGLIGKTNKCKKIYNIVFNSVSVCLLFGFVFSLIVFFQITKIINVKSVNAENNYIVAIKNKLNIDNSQFIILDNYQDYENLELFICLNNIENSMSNNRSKEICNKVISSYKDIRKNEKQKFKQMNFRELKQREIDKKYNIHVE